MGNLTSYLLSHTDERAVPLDKSYVQDAEQYKRHTGICVCSGSGGRCWEHRDMVKPVEPYWVRYAGPGVEMDMPAGKANALGYTMVADADHFVYDFNTPCQSPSSTKLLAGDTILPIYRYTELDFHWPAGNGNGLVGPMDCDGDGPATQSFTVFVCGDSIRMYLGFDGEEPLVESGRYSSVKKLDETTPATSGYVYLQTELGGVYTVDKLDMKLFSTRQECSSAGEAAGRRR